MGAIMDFYLCYAGINTGKAAVAASYLLLLVQCVYVGGSLSAQITFAPTRLI